MQSLDVISVNLWQMLVSLANLVLLFLLVKKFLYKPVMRMLETRRAAIDKDYSDADEAKQQALSDKLQYEEKLRDAKSEADSVVKKAVATASEREKEIIANAREKADGIVRQAENEALLERKKAEDAVKKEIVEVSSLLTEKVLEREVTAADHQRLIDSFIEGIGDDDGTD
ncbi:MAG: F0F1 ATP synthase subunit B [Clostridia bacterium]|nr:F0F1 ATP synthase subunit B [Clostridia bacterium]